MRLVICLLDDQHITLVACIANDMDPDQTAHLGFIVFASMRKVVLSAFEYMQQK